MATRIIAGGDVRQLTIGGRQIRVAPEASLKLAVGGKTNESAASGDGTIFVKQKTRLGGFSDCSVINDTENATLEFLQGLSNSANLVAVVLALANGTVYGAQLMVIGDLDADTGEGTIALEMRGSTFEQI